MADLTPELYQLVGAALRDVAQARFNADVFSRQISFVYEADGLLRRFPVPRVDIDEAEITLHFAVQSVELDPHRQSLRNAAIGSLFDQYSTSIVRESINRVRGVIHGVPAGSLNDAQRAALASFEKRFLSDDSREMLSGRLLQYFNESVDKIVGEDCVLNEAAVKKQLEEFLDQSILTQRELKELAERFAKDIDSIRADLVGIQGTQVGKLGEAVAALRNKYPDYKLTVDPSASALAGAGVPVSTVKIKSTVRNYKWSKVDVDETDLRNVRTLSPE